MRLIAYLIACLASAFPVNAQDRQVLLIAELFEVPLSDTDFDLVFFVDVGVSNPIIDAGYKNQRFDAKLSARKRDTSPDIEISNPKLLIPSDAKDLLIKARAHDPITGEIVFFFPVVYFMLSEEKDVIAVELRDPSLKPRTTTAQSFLESYPFYYRGERNAIAEDNIIPSFNAVRMLVRGDELGAAQWNILYDLFVENADIIAKKEDFLRVVVNILDEHVDLTSEGFSDFYFQFINTVLKDEVGSFKLSSDLAVSQHFLDEQKNMLQTAPLFVYEHLNEALDIYESEKRQYESCIELSALSFKWIEQSINTRTDDWNRVDKRLLAAEIYNAMISSTVCARKLYAALENAEILTISKVAEWMSSEEEYSTYLDSFVYLKEALEEKLALKFIGQHSINEHFVGFKRYVADREPIN